MLASGILGISLDVFNRLYRSGAGAVVTKSLSKAPWEGYPNPTIFGVKEEDGLMQLDYQIPVLQTLPK